MRLVHSTYRLDSARRILQEGLRPASETGRYEYYLTKGSKVICLTAVDDDTEEYGGWGIYHFILNNDWVKEHSEQFREHSDETPRKFQEFMQGLGIVPHRLPVPDKIFHQVLSLQPVPVEALDELVIPDSELIFLNDIEMPQNIRIKTYVKGV